MFDLPIQTMLRWLLVGPALLLGVWLTTAVMSHAWHSLKYRIIRRDISNHPSE